MVQDELVVFRDGQTLVAEGGVCLEVKGGSKGSVVVFADCFWNESFSDGWEWFFGVLIGAVFAGGLSRRRRLRRKAGPQMEFGGGSECFIIGIENITKSNSVSIIWWKWVA